LPSAVCSAVSPAAFNFNRGRDNFANARNSSASSQINPKYSQI
jgi:hypothetical protein